MNNRKSLKFTVDIVSEYVATNKVRVSELPDLIRAAHQAFATLGETTEPNEEVRAYAPAVSIRKSLADPDAIMSLIDGKPYKLLKRHLEAHGLTPAQYREQFNLPADYPMVARSYREERRALAKRIGLGRISKSPAPQKKKLLSPRY